MVAPTSYESLKTFLESAPVARKATRPLSRAARVNVALPEGPAQFHMDGPGPELRPGAGEDPDFTLTLPGGAVDRITSLPSEDVGAFGVEFFRLVLERDPDLKVRVHIDAPASRLLANGYLGVLALGGLKVTWWLLRNGVKNPVAAFERFRRG
jgi:hypothetical protein